MPLMLLHRMGACMATSSSDALELPSSLSLAFHFTDQAAANAILKSRRLMLGNLRNANDPRETEPWSLIIDSPQDNHSVACMARAFHQEKSNARYLCTCVDDHPNADGRSVYTRLRMWAQYGGMHRGG